MIAVLFVGNWLISIGIGLDVMVNALFLGRRYQTISSRIGESIRAGTWAARIRWPAWFCAHCLASIEKVVV